MAHAEVSPQSELSRRLEHVPSHPLEFGDSDTESYISDRHSLDLRSPSPLGDYTDGQSGLAAAHRDKILQASTNQTAHIISSQTPVKDAHKIAGSMQSFANQVASKAAQKANPSAPQTGAEAEIRSAPGLTDITNIQKADNPGQQQALPKPTMEQATEPFVPAQHITFHGKAGEQNLGVSQFSQTSLKPKHISGLALNSILQLLDSTVASLYFSAGVLAAFAESGWYGIQR